MKKIILVIAVALAGGISFCQTGGGNTRTVMWTTPYDGSTFSHMQTAFSFDSKYYAYGSNSGKVTIRDVASAEVYTAYTEHEKQVFSVAFQPGGSLVASGDKTGKVVVFDYSARVKKYSVAAHEKAVTSICFSPDGSKMITGSNDNTVKAWNSMTGEKLYEIAPIKGNVCNVRITPDSRKLIVTTAAMSNGIIVYDLTNGSELEKVPAELIEQADLSSDGRYVATANLKKAVSVWDINSGGLAYKLEAHEKQAVCVGFSPDGQYLATGGQDKQVIIWDNDQHFLKSVSSGTDWVENVVFSPNSEYLAILNKAGTISMYDVNLLLGKRETVASSYSSTSYSSAPAAAAPARSNSTDQYISSVLNVVVADTLYSAALRNYMSYIEFGDESYLNIADQQVKKVADAVTRESENGHFTNETKDILEIAIRVKMEIDGTYEKKLDSQKIKSLVEAEKNLPKESKTGKIFCLFRVDPDGPADGTVLNCSQELADVYDNLTKMLNINDTFVIIGANTLNKMLKERSE